MLKQLISALTQGDTLDRAFSELYEMLDHAQWMFIRANEVLRRLIAPDEVRDVIYARDKAINGLLRGIRRKIVRHLTIHPGTDVAACLALMSVAKDAERIGDYCKNVFEVGQYYREPFHIEAYHEPLEEIRARVEPLFVEVTAAFRASDPEAGKTAIRRADAICTECDEIIERLLQDHSSMETHEAVAYSLLARHYKRVAAHLSNICTAISGKIEDLDFKAK